MIKLPEKREWFAIDLEVMDVVERKDSRQLSDGTPEDERVEHVRTDYEKVSAWSLADLAATWDYLMDQAWLAPLTREQMAVRNILSMETESRVRQMEAAGDTPGPFRNHRWAEGAAGGAPQGEHGSPRPESRGKVIPFRPRGERTE